jgi:hypothetical protein
MCVAYISAKAASAIQAECVWYYKGQTMTFRIIFMAPPSLSGGDS